MKVIYPDNVNSISVDKQNANYPIANVQNDYIKKAYKSTNNACIISAGVSGGSAVALFGMNATSATVKTRSGQVGIAWEDTVIEWHDGAVAGADIDWATETLTTETVKFDTLSTGQAALWCDFTDPGTAFALEITLSGVAGTALTVGVLRSGTVIDLADPRYGIQEGLHDYSVQTELNNGAWYYLKRDIVRTFSFALFEDRASDFYSLMHSVALLRGRQPLAWRLSENVTDWQWIVYATMQAMPSGTHDHKDFSNINVALKEVV